MIFNKELLDQIAWKRVKDELPPDNSESVEVMDKDSNKAFAIACWHNFKIVNGKVEKTEPQFDGWMIQCNGLDVPQIGDVKYWRASRRST